MSPMIESTSLTKAFNGVPAVDGVSLRIDAAQIVGLIGPNGSGKTTTLNLLNGALRPDSGTITVGGTRLEGRASAAFVAAGVSRTFQNPRTFTTITAMDNLMVPVLHRHGSQRTWRAKGQDLLDFVGLGAHRDTPASELSGGQQKLLEFVRALMTDPTVVLMDEPFAGIHPRVKEIMRDRIQEVNGNGTSFIIVSHEIPDLTRLCSQVACMSEGKLIAEGAPDDVTAHPAVIEAYLGHGKAGRGERG